MPSWAFNLARFKPLIWLRIFSLIARPAASSAAVFILKPELSFAMDFSRLELLALSFEYVPNAPTL